MELFLFQLPAAYVPAGIMSYLPRRQRPRQCARGDGACDHVLSRCVGRMHASHRRGRGSHQGAVQPPRRRRDDEPHQSRPIGTVHQSEASRY